MAQPRPTLSLLSPRLAQGVQLPPQGSYATGLVFLADDTVVAAQQQFERCARRCGLRVLAWRAPPTNSAELG